MEARAPQRLQVAEVTVGSLPDPGVATIAKVSNALESPQFGKLLLLLLAAWDSFWPHFLQVSMAQN
jgi:hypothetical protein